VRHSRRRAFPDGDDGCVFAQDERVVALVGLDPRVGVALEVQDEIERSRTTEDGDEEPSSRGAEGHARAGMGDGARQ